MAEITKQRTGEFVRALTKFLMGMPDGAPAKVAMAAVLAQFQLTEYEAGSYPSGPGLRFNYILRFATVDLVKAGWMRKHKGIWTITETGQAAHAQFQNPAAFYQEAQRLYRLWRNATPLDQDEPEPIDDKQIPEQIRTFEEAEEQAWQEILLHLANVPPFDFQDMVKQLLEVMSYHVSWVAPPGKDGGIDIIAWTDPLGTKPPRIKVQVKRRLDAIPVNEMRSFMAMLGEGDVGLYVTTGTFTKDAMDEARMTANRMITLIDRTRFTELWIEHYDKLPESGRRMLPLRPIYFLAPNE